jgi:Domain of unknown function (DUF4386)
MDPISGTPHPSEALPHSRARIAGIVYLSYFVTAISGMYLAHHGLAAYGNALNFFPNVIYAALAVMLYFLFAPVSKSLSLLAACFGFAGSVVAGLGVYNLISSRVNPLYFFGPYCILLGYLVFRSTFLPRALGVVMMLAGVAWLVSLLPSLAKPIFPYVAATGIVAEAALMLWLLIKGVNEERWKRMAAQSS